MKQITKNLGWIFRRKGDPQIYTEYQEKDKNEESTNEGILRTQDPTKSLPLSTNSNPIFKEDPSNLTGEEDQSFKSVDSSESSLSRIQASRLLLDLIKGHSFSFRKKKKNSDEIYLKIKADDGEISDEDSVRRLREALFINIKSFFQSKGDSTPQITRGADIISFPNLEMLEEWNKEAGLAITDSRVKKKKIVVIGLGDVGEAVVRELGTHHEKNNLPCEIIALNRDKAFARARIKDIKKSRNDEGGKSCVSYVAATQDKEIADADLIILTAGVKASRIEAANRRDALKYNAAFINDFARLIKGQKKKDTKVIVITNPVETITQMVQEISEIDPQNIIGSGTGLDSIRYGDELESKFDEYHLTHPIHALVVGEHHGPNMIFAKDKVMMNGKPISETLGGKIGEQELDEILNGVESGVRTAGYPNKNGKPFRKGTCETPARAACQLSYKWLYGDKAKEGEKEILSTSVYVGAGTDNPYGVTGPCFIGLPITFGENGKIEVKKDYLTNEEQIARLQKISKGLVEGRLTVTPELLATSNLLNALLDRNEDNSDVVKNLTAIMTSKDVGLSDCSENLRKLYSITKEEYKIKISVKPLYSEYEEYLLNLLNVALRDSGLVDREADKEQCSIVTHDGKNKLTILTEQSTQEKLLQIIGSRNPSTLITTARDKATNLNGNITTKGEIN